MIGFMAAIAPCSRENTTIFIKVPLDASPMVRSTLLTITSFIRIIFNPVTRKGIRCGIIFTEQPTIIIFISAFDLTAV